MMKSSDGRFRIEGGRGGLVTFHDGARLGQLDWEMLVAGKFDIVIYGEDCRWTAPEQREMTRQEVIGLVRALALAVRARINLWFADGSVELGLASAEAGPDEES
jgi:prepilin-type processing-associated H-X9-DG protein